MLKFAIQVRVGCLAEWLRSGYGVVTEWSGLHFARGLASRDLTLQSLHATVGWRNALRVLSEW